MKKKTMLGILIVFVLMIGTFLGTWAYFSKTFKSDNNLAKAAVFDVDVVGKNGKTIANADFNLDEDLYPGMKTKEVYQFDIKRNNTKLPVQYTVSLITSGNLFKAGTPVTLTLQKQVDNKWENVSPESTLKPSQDVERFRILVDWLHGKNDIDFQGAKGNIHLSVFAEQVDAEEQEPVGPPYYTGAIEFKATPNGKTFKTNNKEVTFYKNDQGKKVIEIKMGDGKDEFESKVGNTRIVESIENGKTWYRVYTDYEYFASETQLWRVGEGDVTTTEYGKLTFKKTLGPYIMIQSKELYDWFIAK
ncbi:hypothetical protein [Bacillus andreraoultii]|uniref:hypothetical protein n=1 Tax=Bacillus andreraoultii TaxID=1499685 RepID=UPI00053BB502|nr:hypothetical protein [Bacillus andreraoultii]